MGLNKLMISKNVTQKLRVYQQNCRFLIFEWYPCPGKKSTPRAMLNIVQISIEPSIPRCCSGNNSFLCLFFFLVLMVMVMMVVMAIVVLIAKRNTYKIFGNSLVVTTLTIDVSESLYTVYGWLNCMSYSLRVLFRLTDLRL